MPQSSPLGWTAYLSGGLGGAFGFFWATGNALPFPECEPFKGSIQLRGLGLMLGFQVDAKAVNGIEDFQKTNKTPALFLVELLAESGLLTVPAGPDVIRWLPPLNVMEDQIMEALDIMRTVFENINT